MKITHNIYDSVDYLLYRFENFGLRSVSFSDFIDWVFFESRRKGSLESLRKIAGKTVDECEANLVEILVKNADNGTIRIDTESAGIHKIDVTPQRRFSSSFVFISSDEKKILDDLSEKFVAERMQAKVA